MRFAFGNHNRNRMGKLIAVMSHYTNKTVTIFLISKRTEAWRAKPVSNNHQTRLSRVN